MITWPGEWKRRALKAEEKLSLLTEQLMAWRSVCETRERNLLEAEARISALQATIFEMSKR